MIVALYGPSGSGKTEIQKHLTFCNFPRIITATTRAPRNHEIDGKHYIFLDRDDFEGRVHNHQFIEWTSYNNELYGTLKSSVENIIDQDRCATIILDLAGILSLKRLFSNVLAIYIGADIESIKRRLEARAGDDKDISQRLVRARDVELTEQYIQAADSVIWNNDGDPFAKALKSVKDAINGALPGVSINQDHLSR